MFISGKKSTPNQSPNVHAIRINKPIIPAKDLINAILLSPYIPAIFCAVIWGA